MIKQNSTIGATGLVPLSKSFPFLDFFIVWKSPSIHLCFQGGILKNVINFLILLIHLLTIYILNIFTNLIMNFN